MARRLLDGYRDKERIIRALSGVCICLAVLAAPPCEARDQRELKSRTERQTNDLSAKLVRSRELESVGEESLAKLASRVSTFLRVWNQGTIEEYEKLLEDWGGTARLDTQDREYRRMREEDWSLAGADCSLRSLEVGSLRTGITAGVLPDKRTYEPWPYEPGMGMGCVHFCVYSFGSGQFELARDGELVIQIELPVQTHNGRSLLFGMRWVWEPESSNWVPWLLHQRAQPGEGVCVLFF